MAKPYSQDLRDRVIDAVERGKMSRREAGRHYEISESVAIKLLERLERHGSREPVGHGGDRASKLMAHRQFLETARAEKSDVTLQALCDRLSAERGVKADTSMMSRFFRKIGVTLKKALVARERDRPEIGRLDPQGEFYVCGPIPMLEAAKRRWREAGGPSTACVSRPSATAARIRAFRSWFGFRGSAGRSPSPRTRRCSRRWRRRMSA